MILDILGEPGSAPSWLYKAWGFMLFKSYRESTKREYKKMTTFFRVIDIALSAVCFVGEIIFVIYILNLILGI